MMMREHWGRLPVDDRRELARILRKSQGRYTNVNADERRELFRIVRELDLITAGRKLMPMHGGVRKRHR
jgi:hypothetical protein